MRRMQRAQRFSECSSVAATSAWMWHYVTMCGDCIQAQGKGASIKARLHAQTIENQRDFIIFLKMNFRILILHVHSRALFKTHFVREPPARSVGNGCHGGATRDKDLAAWRLPPSFSWWTFPWTHSDLWLNGRLNVCPRCFTMFDCLTSWNFGFCPVSKCQVQEVH